MGMPRSAETALLEDGFPVLEIDENYRAVLITDS